MGCNGSKTAAAATAQKPQEQQLLEGDFKITLQRTADAQALGLKVVDQAGVLAVEAVNEEGLVPDFIKANANSTEQQLPEQGDRIVAVNGVYGDAEKMKAEIKQKLIVLTIQRKKPETAAAEQPPAALTEAGQPAAAEETEKKAAEEAAPAAAEAAPTAEAEAPAEQAAEAKAEEAAAEEAKEEAVVVEEAPAAEAPVVDATEEKEETVAAGAYDTLETGVEVADLQDVVVDDEAKEERLCKMSVC